MRILKTALLVFVAAAVPLAAADQASSLDQVVDRISSRETALVSSLRQYSPLVETYIQNLRPDDQLGSVPAGDNYFLGRADLSTGVELKSLTEKAGASHKMLGGLKGWFTFSLQFLPRGFLQMIYIDTNGFDRQHYKFDYARREFLGEVRCLVFDVTPLPKSGKGRFLGRIWVRSEKAGASHKMLGGLKGWFTFSLQFLPRGFLQMIYIDTNGFDRQHYKFDYARREFLGEVRCLVFDVTPLPKSGKGRFLGRIWVEDQDFTIVRFNGAYSGSSKTSFYFHFDSWRVNAGPALWLPAFIYSEESNVNYAMVRRLQFKAQTRLWGYNLGRSGQEQELSKVLIESASPIKDQTVTSNDMTPVQAQRAWDRQAEENVGDRLERMGLIAPRGEVDKVLETVVNNLEVTNNLDIQPEVRCRVLLTSTLESFTIGHTIVLSRGLIDVLPDEASLATMEAHELGH